MSEPAYTRLPVDERRAQIVAAATTLFAEHAYEEISMREIASAADVSKALLYHYFPSKIDLFKEAVSEAAGELAELIRPMSGGAAAPAPEQLASTLDAYLTWIDDHARTWTKLMQSAATLPEAREIVERFRAETMAMVLAGLGAGTDPPAALRTAIVGWLGFMDAAILDWTQHRDLTRDQLRELLVSAFGAALLAASQ